MEEFANLGQPRALPDVEFEIHSGARLPFTRPRQRNATAKFRPLFRTDVTLDADVLVSDQVWQTIGSAQFNPLSCGRVIEWPSSLMCP
jgi:hypothetical protein